jgi:hypothetical protein
VRTSINYQTTKLSYPNYPVVFSSPSSRRHRRRSLSVQALRCAAVVVRTSLSVSILLGSLHLVSEPDVAQLVVARYDLHPLLPPCSPQTLAATSLQPWHLRRTLAFRSSSLPPPPTLPTLLLRRAAKELHPRRHHPHDPWYPKHLNHHQPRRRSRKP